MDIEHLPLVRRRRVGKVARDLFGASGREQREGREEQGEVFLDGGRLDS